MGTNSGEIVDITSGNINLDSMHTEIQDTITYTRDFADEMQLTLAVAIRDLQATVGDYNPNLIDVDTDLAPLDRPVFPTLPTFDDYSSAIRDDLISWVSESLVNGGTGLTDGVHASIIEREKETRRNSQDETYRTSLNSVGSRGFNLPTGQIASLQAKVATEILNKDQDSLNNTTVKDFDLAQVNTHFTVTTGIELEKTLVSTWATIQETTVSVFNAQIQGVVGEYDALSKLTGIEIERIKTEAGIAIKNEELGLNAYTAMSALAEKVAESIATIASQSIASALGAINTSLSNSYSGGESRSEGWTHGDSLSEGHSYSA